MSLPGDGIGFPSMIRSVSVALQHSPAYKYGCGCAMGNPYGDGISRSYQTPKPRKDAYRLPYNRLPPCIFLAVDDSLEANVINKLVIPK